jgi:hypothetical protein
MAADFETKVKAIIPDAEAYPGIMGWGIFSPSGQPKTWLAICRFKTVGAAWKNAWDFVNVRMKQSAP